MRGTRGPWGAERWVRATTPRTALGTAAGFCLTALLLGVPGQVQGQGQASSLRIVGPARLTLDPVCNARAGASLVSLLRNDGSTPTRLALSADEPASKTAGKLAVAKVTVTPLDAAGRPVTNKTLLVPGELVGVRLDLTGTLDSGEWEIEVRNAGTPVGTIAVVSPQAGFGVKLDAATPDNPELAFERGKPATIALKNDDSVGYLVSGQYSVRGVVKNAERRISLSANGGGELALIPPAEWFHPQIRMLFKDDVADGRLTLRFSSAACPDAAAAPARVFKVKTTLAAWPAATKDFRGNLVLLGTLFLGGICSLALNFFLPAHGRRLRVRTQLSLVARRIDDLPMQMDPRVRTSVTVEQRQLAERLRRLKFYDMQFSPEMTEIEQGLTRLSTRLDLLGHMELVLNRYWRQRSGSLPLSVSDDIEELRRQLLDLLKRSDPGDSDIQAAQALIKKIDERLTNATAANPELAGRLAKQVDELQKDFNETSGPIGTSPIWKSLHADLVEGFAGVLGQAGPTDPAKIAPADYVRLERAVFILDKIGAFIKLCGATGAAGTLTAQHRELRDRLMLNLRGGSWDQLKRVQRLIRQMREGIFYEQVETQIDQQRVAIEPSRIVVRQFEPTELRVMFLDKRVHGSAAREEYTCNWVFEYANLKATGWSVSHFFPSPTEPELQPSEPEVGWLRKAWRVLTGLSGSIKPEVPSKPYKVDVRFVRDDGYAVPGVVTGEIRVRPPLRVKVRASFWMEWLRLALALGIAAAGLIAGARDQVLKLDVFPALIAVFLVGFGSDRIKNLFTQRAPSAPEEPKPAGAG